MVSNISADSDFFMAITGNLPDTLSSMTVSYKKVKAEGGSQSESGGETERPEQSQQETETPVNYAVNSAQEATKAVEAYLGIAEGDSSAPYIKVEREDSSSYTLRTYTITYNADTTKTETTLGWYTVNKVSGAVSESQG